MRILTARFRLAALLPFVLGAGLILSFASSAVAAPLRLVQAYATGQIVAQAPCSATEVCQQTIVSGVANILGAFTGVLNERVDITTGLYTGTAVFTTADSSTITTQYSGQATPPNSQGVVFFSETHQVVSGTGRFANSEGTLNVVGTSSASGKIQIVGMGSLSQ